MENTVRTIKKSQREEIRIALSEFTKDGKTYDMISARVFYDDAAESRPGRNGHHISPRLLPAPIQGLQAAAAPGWPCRSVSLRPESRRTPRCHLPTCEWS